MAIKLKIIKTCRAGLWLAAIPTIGLQKTDVTGFEKLSLLSPTFILQGFITAACLATLPFIAAASKSTWRDKKNLQIQAILLACFLSTAASIQLGGTSDLQSWLKLVQSFAPLAIISLAITTLSQRIGAEDTGILILKIIRTYFYAACLILLMFFIISPDMVYFSGEGSRGPRLGGSVIHPNTLSLFAILFLCSSVISHRSKNRAHRTLSIGLGGTVIILTGSSGGILMLIAWGALSAFKGSKMVRLVCVGSLFIFFMTSFAVFLAVVTGFFDTGSLAAELPGTWADRLIIYSAASDGILSNPFFGVGSYEGVKIFFETIFSDSYFLPQHAHNYFFDVVLSRGALGGLPYLFLAFYGTTAALMQVYKSRNIHDLGHIFSLIFIFVFLQGLMESSVSGPIKPMAHFGLFSSLFMIILLKRSSTFTALQSRIRSSAANDLNANNLRN